MNGLCFSLTFFFNSTDVSIGTSVSVNNKAPSNAKPSVYAIGLNILPSTFWNENIGMSAVMIISLEKNTARARSLATRLISPNLSCLLNSFIPTFFACASNATNRPSTITTAPSIIIPMSIAPIDIRLALIPFI